MTFASVIFDLFRALPLIEERYRKSLAYTEDEEPLPYLVFGAVLVPALEQALVAGDLATILKVAAFLEEAAERARDDADLCSLIRIEIGDWLRRLEHADHLAMWLGPETKRVCGYRSTSAMPLHETSRANKHAGPVQRLKMRLSGLLKRENR